MFKISFTIHYAYHLLTFETYCTLYLSLFIVTSIECQRSKSTHYFIIRSCTSFPRHLCA